MASFFQWLAKAASSTFSNCFGGKRKQKFGYGMSFGALAAVSGGIYYLFFNSSPESIEHSKAAVESDVDKGSSLGERKGLDFSVGSEDHELKVDDSIENLTPTEDIEETIQLSSHMDDYGTLEAKESETHQILVDGLANKLTFQVFDEQQVDPLVKSWMNLKFDVEGVGLELEELVFDGLVEELILDFD